MLVLLAGALDASPAAAQTVAELMLRPLNSRVLVKSPSQGWRTGANMERLRQGDSVRVESGAAEIVFSSGPRAFLGRGDRFRVIEPAQGQGQGRAVPRSVRAAVDAALDYVRGKTSQPDPQNHVFEAPTQTMVVPGSGAASAAPAGQPVATAAPMSAGQQASAASGQHGEHAQAASGVVSRAQSEDRRDTGGRLRGAVSRVSGTMAFLEPLDRSGEPGRPELARLRLPVDLSAWRVLPGWPAVDWSRPDADLVRVYPANPDRGCPPAGPAVVDSILASPARTRDLLAERLRPGQAYRVELGMGERVRLGCIRVATVEEEREVFARLRAARADYAHTAPEGGAAGLALLEAAMLAEAGFYGDALLRLQPVVTRPDAPAVAVQLWTAILAQERLLLSDR